MKGNENYQSNKKVNSDKVYACIDLKSFYASVECVERGLNPLKTNLVVADISRTEKTVCLAVSPSLKAYGIGGRCRLFELIERVKFVNCERKIDNKIKKYIGKSVDDDEIKSNPLLEVDYIIAKPRMSYYMKYSTMIYNIYLKYISPEDMFVYSIDELFLDITSYVNTYKMKPEDLVTHIIKDIYDTTGITATAGIGTNLFLAKIAMDVIAKKMPANDFGVRLASLDEFSFRKELWNHKPITDIWRIGRGIASKLESIGIETLGEIAKLSLIDENRLYKLFGINAELIIDHAWGYEPVTMKDVKSYKPCTTSISSGQVLHCPTNVKVTRTIVKEMADALSLDLVSKHYVTNQLVLTIQYDVSNITNKNIKANYHGEIITDYLGRLMPKHAHGTTNLEYKTSSTILIVDAITKLFDKIVNPVLLCRKINISANNLVDEDTVLYETRCVQLSLLEDEEERVRMSKEEELNERKIQRTVIKIKDKYGKNAILKGTNLLKEATGIDRNKQIGGHHE